MRRHANNAGNLPGPGPIAPKDKISRSGEPLTPILGQLPNICRNLIRATSCAKHSYAFGSLVQSSPVQSNLFIQTPRNDRMRFVGAKPTAL